MELLYRALSLSAQTTYAELLDQVRASALSALRALPGSFQRQTKRGRRYVYYSFRDVDGRNRMAYVGPESERVSQLIERLEQAKASPARQRVVELSRAAQALGCAAMLLKHYRVLERLEQYGFFRAGGLLVGTHAFVALGNMLGVRWTSGERTLDPDFAHAGRNISVALGADVSLSVHDALASLEMGLLPIAEFSGRTGAQWRNPADPELRLDFLTPMTRDGGPVHLPELGLALECLKFMEFSLLEPQQALVMGATGASLVNVPAPARYAVHKLIVHGERPESERAKAHKDLTQAAALAQYHLHEQQADRFAQAWSDALGRGPNWRRRAEKGRAALLARYPELDEASLWPDAPRPVAKRAAPSSKRRGAR